MIFDTHSHYNDKQFDADRAVVLESLKDAGVTQVVNVSASWKDLMDTLELISKVPFMYGAAGIHPDHVGELNEERMEQLREYCHRDKIVAVGEIGLDYHFDAEDDVSPCDHDVQMSCMARQLELARAHNVPVELHLRHEASDEQRTSHVDAERVLREVGIPQAGCVLHCFGEDRATMERFCDLGCYIAYGGAATFKRNTEVREAFAATPLDRLLFETDCPYMAPEPIRGLECEPAMIGLTARALINDRVDRTGESAQVIAQAAWDNAQRLFADRPAV